MAENIFARNAPALKLLNIIIYSSLEISKVLESMDTERLTINVVNTLDDNFLITNLGSRRNSISVMNASSPNLDSSLCPALTPSVATVYGLSDI